MTDYELKGESYYYLGLLHKNGQGVTQDKNIYEDYFGKALGYKCKRPIEFED
jgi:TPR repeat protein